MGTTAEESRVAALRGKIDFELGHSGSSIVVLTDWSKRAGWYFRRSWISFVTVPLFILGVAGIGYEAVQDFTRAKDLAVAIMLVLGWFGSLAMVGLWVIPFVPTVLYYFLLRNLPRAWELRGIRTTTKAFAIPAVVLCVVAFCMAYNLALVEFIRFIARTYAQ